MASRSDVVVVTINYQCVFPFNLDTKLLMILYFSLGTLGFLALDDGVTNGNFGQMTALRWIKKHIANFGGDPSRVTIYGQSAGAGSVRTLLGSPPAFGLFAGAIAQSNLGGFGYATTYTKYLSLEDEYSKYGAPLVKSVGCGNGTAEDFLACLRKLPAQTLISAPNAPR